MGGLVHLMPATRAHLLELSRTMRPADVAEVQACGMTPLEMLEESTATGESFTATFDGEVAAVFGVAPSGDEFAWVWCLTGAPVDKRPLEFFRLYRGVVKAFLRVHEGLKQFVDCRYTGALRVAEACGFSLLPPIPFGPQGLLFQPVYIRRS